MSRRSRADGDGLNGRRILITGGARGIGAALGRRLHRRGARVGLLGLEPDLLATVAADCGAAPWQHCDVADRHQVDHAVGEIVAALGGLDVAVANAGVGAQLTLVNGDHTIMERTLAVNTVGVYYTVAAVGPHVSHAGGYVLITSSAAAGLHLPLMGAYCASKAAVEALGDCLRIELRASGARVGVAYFAEIDTDMTSRGMRTRAASHLDPSGLFTRVAPLAAAVGSLERGIDRRARRIYTPGWVGRVLPLRMVAQRAVELHFRNGVEEALRVARDEHADLTTAQPERAP
ncbi:MAG TPA: SDR family NAD(P)-dependent oxidoreductase [Acidimicrobiales bacterium]|nr:SDR family NAD(P)-dependent oxidoreductase [Acidimicrobiales bacterium]